MDVIIKKAEPAELATGLAMLRAAGLWLRERKIDYWQNWLAPPASHINWIKRGFDNHEFYFALTGTEITALFRLQWQDKMFWPEQDDPAGYLHSFTTARKYYGMGLGRYLLGWIEEECRKNHKEYLRLDCGAAISRLCRYYLEQGFRLVDEKLFYGEIMARFGKRLAPVSH